ncbi:phenylacetate-CoA ligase [Tistlia consotensis]|uniref:Phenylacetate-CoA ligase n=1 Tax=Tistlia consotensis USBA 355 TaxID=560819 RepID=A0A1Y6C127_9PROT|nr:AMP-binding protein [Tistlia consotensis]SMF30013.1 phenylacetate-CoA ligase [Tistlia consotensis USBA 355]SNR90585.1 phenylacetate-CoA ligase [Tistlia consotensis]
MPADAAFGQGRPFREGIWDERETWSRDRLAAHQREALTAQLAYLAAASPFYAERFRDCGFAPGDFREPADLGGLPFTTKDDYRAALDAELPTRSRLLACDPAAVVRVHFSSGTTGQPTPTYWTRADLARWTDLYARYLYAQGLRPGDRFQCMFGYSWFVGGLGATYAAERIGALVIPAGNVDTKRQIETIFRYQVDAVIGTPSFMAHVAEAALEGGRDLRQSRVRLVGLGGEPGASVPATRRRLAEAWGAEVSDCYGSLEFQPIAWDVGDGLGPALTEDFFLAEVIDPETKRPVADGTPGVLVLTHLDKQACPLLRWWTGDMVVRRRVESPDGRTHARLEGGVRGRADDMLIVRGVNVFPTAVEEVVRAAEGGTGEYRIVVDPALADPVSGSLNRLKLIVEAGPDAPQDFVERLQARVKEQLSVRAEVELVEAGALPRSVHKAQRIVRL